MRFGIEFGSYPADLDPAQVCQQYLQRAQAAYKGNFEGLFVAQHYVTGPDAAPVEGARSSRPPKRRGAVTR